MILIDVFLPAMVTFFVVIDPIGVAPLFASLTDGTSAAHKRLMAIKSVLVAAVILLGFAFGGRFLLSAMGIDFSAFRAAGGIMLFIIALEMVFEKRTERREQRVEDLVDDDRAGGSDHHEDISVFPMAIPMIAGPGSIASIMLYMSNTQGAVLGQIAVLGAMSANLLACLLLFLSASWVMRVMGPTIAAMITRVLGVLLAALAAQLIFDGIKGALLVMPGAQG